MVVFDVDGNSSWLDWRVTDFLFRLRLQFEFVVVTKVRDADSTHFRTVKLADFRLSRIFHRVELRFVLFNPAEIHKIQKIQTSLKIFQLTLQRFLTRSSSVLALNCQELVAR